LRIPRLVRRRELPVPTAFGLLVAAGLAALAGVAALHALHPFLAPTAPVGSGVLVVEGWAGEPGFAEAERRFATGRYDRVIAAGGPIERDSPIAAAHSWAEYAGQALAQRGIPPDRLHVVPAPASAQDRTFLAAVTVRDWLATHAPDANRLDVVTLGPHGRRSRRLHRLALGDAFEVGVVSATPTNYDPARWWSSSEGAKSVLAEAVGLGWSVCCFTPGARGSHEETWGARE
jgi:hypothetical protein